jgi:hypothetical protein
MFVRFTYALDLHVILAYNSFFWGFGGGLGGGLHRFNADRESLSRVWECQKVYFSLLDRNVIFKSTDEKRETAGDELSCQLIDCNLALQPCFNYLCGVQTEPKLTS